MTRQHIMVRVGSGLLVLILVGVLSGSLMSQESIESADATYPLLSDDVIELRLALRFQRRATIQARADRLSLERQLLEMDLQRWRDDTVSLQSMLDTHYSCAYDLEAQKCEQETS